MSEENNGYLLSIRTGGGHMDYQHFDVPKQVYIYVQQLEYAIRVLDATSLKEAYPGRFELRAQHEIR